LARPWLGLEWRMGLARPWLGLGRRLVGSGLGLARTRLGRLGMGCPMAAVVGLVMKYHQQT